MSTQEITLYRHPQTFSWPETIEPQHLRFCKSEEDLIGIHQRGVDALLWERTLSAPLQALLCDMEMETNEGGSITSSTDSFEEHLAGLRERHPVGAKELLHDIASLVAVFSLMAQTASPKVRLKRVTGDACRRFHIDNVYLRLLCTYIGPGTQLIPADSLQQIGQLADRFDEKYLMKMPMFSVLLLKGRQHPNLQQELFHRSPPLRGTDKTRLFFCLDAPHPPAGAEVDNRQPYN